jgi:hypothetical protein
MESGLRVFLKHAIGCSLQEMTSACMQTAATCGMRAEALHVTARFFQSSAPSYLRATACGKSARLFSGRGVEESPWPRRSLKFWFCRARDRLWREPSQSTADVATASVSARRGNVVSHQQRNSLAPTRSASSIHWGLVGHERYHRVHNC